MDFDKIGLPDDPQEEELKSLQVHFVAAYEQLKSEFSSFLARSKELLENATKSLTEAIDTDPVMIQESLLNVTSQHYSIGQAVADGKAYLQMYEMLHYSAKKQKYSESDRRLYTGIKTLVQSNLVAQLKNAEDKMEKRITVLQSIVKAETARMQTQERSSD